jgi:hypothetical protein
MKAQMVRPRVYQGLALAAMAAVLSTACSDDDGYYEDACDDQRVESRADPTGDFANYHTFSVPSEDDLPPGLPINVQAGIQAANEAAEKELRLLGLVKVEADEMPDLTLFSLVRSSEETGVVWTCVPGYWWGYWGWMWSSCAWLEAVPVDYTVGTLVVGVADPKAEKVVFGGAAKGILECRSNTYESINTAVHAIFAGYPTPP